MNKKISASKNTEPRWKRRINEGKRAFSSRSKPILTQRELRIRNRRKK